MADAIEEVTMDSLAKYLQGLADYPENDMEKTQVARIREALKDLQSGNYEKAIDYLDDRNLDLSHDRSTLLSPTYTENPAEDKTKAQALEDEANRVYSMINFLESSLPAA